MKKSSFKNIKIEEFILGAILFFLPGAGVTMANVEEAALAAKDRAIHINKLKEKKNC